MVRKSKVFVLSYEDYNNGDDDDVWLFEFSEAGLKQALSKLYSLVNKWYNDDIELLWHEGREPVYKDFLNKENLYKSYTNDDWLYFYIHDQTVWRNSSIDIEGNS